jgi:hypothetical protein
VLSPTFTRNYPSKYWAYTRSYLKRQDVKETVAMVLSMRLAMATSPQDDIKKDPGIDKEVGYTKEVLEVLKNRVLPSLIEASESSIKKGCVERITIDIAIDPYGRSKRRQGLHGATSLVIRSTTSASTIEQAHSRMKRRSGSDEAEARQSKSASIHKNNKTISVDRLDRSTENNGERSVRSVHNTRTTSAMRVANVMKCPVSSVRTIG